MGTSLYMPERGHTCVCISKQNEQYLLMSLTHIADQGKDVGQGNLKTLC